MAEGAEELVALRRLGGVAAIADAVRQTTLEPFEVAELAVRQQRRWNDELHAVTQAVWQPGDPEGPLVALPVVVKDNVDVRGVVTSNGRPLSKSSVASCDSDVVALLRRTGASIVGKTNLPEFASSAVTTNATYGDTRNPWDLSRSAGGSSGGSAVAVAAGMAWVAVATDTAGSAVIPAAVTGVCGYRPTRGLLGRTGITPLSPSLDEPGLITANATDLRAVLQASGVLGHEAGRAARLGVLGGWFGNSTPQVAAVFGTFVDGLAAADLEIVDVSTPSAEGVLDHARAVYGRESAASLTGLLRPGVQYATSVERRRHAPTTPVPPLPVSWADEVLDAFTSADVLICPTVPCLAPKLGEAVERASTDLVRHTYPWCFTGVPLVSVPVGLADGLPVSVLVISRAGDDALAIEAAIQIEAVVAGLTPPAGIGGEVVPAALRNLTTTLPRSSS